MSTSKIVDYILESEPTTLTNDDLKRMMRLRKFYRAKKEYIRGFYLPLAIASFLLVLLLFLLFVPPVRIGFVSVTLAVLGASAMAYIVPGLFGGLFLSALQLKLRDALSASLAHEHATRKMDEETHALLYGLSLMLPKGNKTVVRPFPVMWGSGESACEGYLVFLPGTFRVYATGKCGAVYVNEFSYEAEGTDDYPLHSKPDSYITTRKPELERRTLCGGDGSTVMLSDDSWGRLIDIRWVDVSRLSLTKGIDCAATEGSAIAQVYLPKNRTGQAELMYFDHDGNPQTRYVDMDRLTVTSLESAKKDA